MDGYGLKHANSGHIIPEIVRTLVRPTACVREISFRMNIIM